MIQLQVVIMERRIKMKRLFLTITYILLTGLGETLADFHEVFQENELSGSYQEKWTTIRDVDQWVVDAFQKPDIILILKETIKKTKDWFQAGCKKDLSQDEKYLSEDEKKRKADFITILWEASEELRPFNCIASFICMQTINEIVQSSNYDLAFNLLISQTKKFEIKKEESEDEVVKVNIEFVDKINSGIIETAIQSIKSERNGSKAKDANAIIKELAQEKYGTSIRLIAKDEK